jgi:hypothetical protein
MVEVFKNLFVGNEADCTAAKYKEMAVIHACKFPCHRAAVGYKSTISATHPNYLILERGNNLFLNMVDMEQELMPQYTHPIVRTVLNFIHKHIDSQTILIHCNQGQSRSPALAMLYLVCFGHIANQTFESACIDFKKIYPMFQAGLGIAKYMKRNWVDLMGFKDKIVQ